MPDIITPEVKKAIEEDIAIDRFNLVDESARTPQLLSRYLLLYSEEKNKAQYYRMKYFKRYRERKDYYLGQADDEVYEKEPLDRKIIRQDVNDWLNADNELCALQAKLKLQESIVEYLERIVKEIERRTFTIKNMQEFIKFEAGG